MKQEIHDIAVEAAKASPGLLATGWTLNNAVALATFFFILLQIVYLIRKWVREESAWGIKIKRWADRNSGDTDFGSMGADE